jgi:hypothetical protein
MAFSFSLFTNWAVGVLNGYKQKENGLPNSIKYGTMGVTTAVAMIKTLGNFDAPNVVRATGGQKLAGLFIAVPILMSTNFCVGHHLGKAVRYAEDDGSSKGTKVRLQLL